jgi:hypothetical protein
MRAWGRTGQVNGQGGTWVAVTTDANGYNDAVFLTALCHVLKLNLYESPFFSSYGIPAQQSVVTQVFPDYYAAQTQTQFASAFAALAITRVPNTSPPTYSVNPVFHAGAVPLSGPVPT